MVILILEVQLFFKRKKVRSIGIAFVRLLYLVEDQKADPTHTLDPPPGPSPHRTNFFQKKKFFENCLLRWIIWSIWKKRNPFSSIHSKDTGSTLYWFTLFFIGNENSFYLKNTFFWYFFREKSLQRVASKGKKMVEKMSWK